MEMDIQYLLSIISLLIFSKKMKNYYQILQISQNATQTAIENAYKRLSLQWHPNKLHPDRKYAEQKFHDIAEAYDVLSDQKRRIHYDFFLKSQVSLDQAQNNFSTMFPSLHLPPVQTTHIKKPLLSDLRQKDYYSKLGVSRLASQRQIQQAYKKLAEKYHPRNNIGSIDAQIKFMEIDEAYNALKHDLSRKTYDRWFFSEFSPRNSDRIFNDFFKNSDFSELQNLKLKSFEQLRSDFSKPLMPLNTFKNDESYQTESFYTKNNNEQSGRTVTINKQIRNGKVYERRKEQISLPNGHRQIIETINQNGHITTNKMQLLPGQSVPKQLMY